MVLQGHGLLAGADGVAQSFGPNSVVIFAAGENHSIQAVNEDLVALVFLREAPDAKATEDHRIGGKIHGVA